MNAKNKLVKVVERGDTITTSSICSYKVLLRKTEFLRSDQVVSLDYWKIQVNYFWEHLLLQILTLIPFPHCIYYYQLSLLNYLFPFFWIFISLSFIRSCKAPNSYLFKYCRILPSSSNNSSFYKIQVFIEKKF